MADRKEKTGMENVEGPGFISDGNVYSASNPLDIMAVRAIADHRSASGEEIGRVMEARKAAVLMEAWAQEREVTGG